jgi:hypothetical protein
MINSQNNERVFFADGAVLVEGMSDRIVFSSLLDAGSTRFANNEAIEIIEVGGKNNFEGYRLLLSALNTPCKIIADLDFLKQVGSPQVRALFRADDAKAWEELKRKKSIDGKSAVAGLRTAIADGDTSGLAAFVAYLDNRHTSLTMPLTGEEQTVLDQEILRLRGENILVLPAGEIEDYLPPGGTDVGAIVEHTVNRNWINSVAQPERRAYLATLICEILGPNDAMRVQLLAQARDGVVAFPVPLSERGVSESIADERIRT